MGRWPIRVGSPSMIIAVCFYSLVFTSHDQTSVYNLFLLKSCIEMILDEVAEIGGCESRRDLVVWHVRRRARLALVLHAISRLPGRCLLNGRRNQNLNINVILLENEMRKEIRSKYSTL